MSCQASVHCQLGDNGFAIVNGPDPDCTKKNNSAPSYRTVCQSVVNQHNQLWAVAQLENKIFTKTFSLIEAYYRPVTKLGNSTDRENCKPSSYKIKRRRAKANFENSTAIPISDMYTAIKLPRKKIRNLKNAYCKQHELKTKNINKMDASVVNLHQKLIDWHLVFSTITKYPNEDGNLAKELNYDLLFDYEDVIGYSATLLSNARQQFLLRDELVINSSINPANDDIGKCNTFETRSNSHKECNEFVMLLELVRQLIDIKKAQLELFRNKENKTKGVFSTNWFTKNETPCNTQNVDDKQTNVILSQLNHLDVENEINYWEDFSDIVDIL